jgi:hypothetical protein
MPSDSAVAFLDKVESNEASDIAERLFPLGRNKPDGPQVNELYRLITTLHDPRRFPAESLTRLYHERWEIETAFLSLRTPCSTPTFCARATAPGSSRRSGRC